MSKKQIQDFCTRHDACKDGTSWALENCTSMQEVWAKAKPEWLLWVALKVLSDRDLRLFAVFCARSCISPQSAPESIAAIDCAEQFANCEASREELATAWSAAWSAARSAAESAAESAARSAAQSAARSAAESAQSAAESAQSAAESAAWSSAAWSAAESARSAAESARSARSARSAARSAQAAWLRENTTPDFGK